MRAPVSFKDKFVEQIFASVSFGVIHGNNLHGVHQIGENPERRSYDFPKNLPLERSTVVNRTTQLMGMKVAAVVMVVMVRAGIGDEHCDWDGCEHGGDWHDTVGCDLNLTLLSVAVATVSDVNRKHLHRGCSCGGWCFCWCVPSLLHVLCASTDRLKDSLGIHLKSHAKRSTSCEKLLFRTPFSNYHRTLKDTSRKTLCEKLIMHSLWKVNGDICGTLCGLLAGKIHVPSP